MSSKVVRTPDSQFSNLKDYPFNPKFVDIDNGRLRMHYVDEGPKDGPVILMLHGEPSWSYLYRHMIPVCSEAGNRVIAPDLIGFGKSDKLTNIDDYSYQTHVDWMSEFINKLALKDITLVCQDWGSLIGLRVAAENEQLFSNIVVGNGFLPTGDQQVPFAFKVWKNFAVYSPWFPIGRIVDMGTRRKLTSQEIKAYDAPFPGSKYKAGARAFPKLVPTSPENPATKPNREAWKVLDNWQKPFLTTFSNGDPITKGGDKYLRERIPGCAGQEHITLRGGHFLQEDSPKEFAMAVNKLVSHSCVKK